MHRSELSLQYYVQRVGEQVFSPPFLMEKMDSLVFVLKTTPGKLDELLERELNEPWEQAFALRGVRHRYRAAHDWIVVVVSYVDKLYPARYNDWRKAQTAQEKLDARNALRTALRLVLPPGASDADVEAMADVSASQRELIVMIPVKDEGENPTPGQSVGDLWYVPLVLNDLPPAVLAGRELFGYPKVLAHFGLVDGAQQPIAAGQPLIDSGKINWSELSISMHAPAKRQDGTFNFGLHEALKIRASAHGNPPDPDATECGKEARERFLQRVEFLFLRQFRDPEFDERASYQAAVSGSATAKAGFLGTKLQACTTHTFEFFFSALGKPEIVDALGVQVGPNANVVPDAVFTLDDQEVVVTRGRVRWDKP